MVKILDLEEQDETQILQNRDENRDYLLQKEVLRRQQMLDEDEFVLQFWRNTYRADVLKTTEEVRVEREVLSREQAAIDIGWWRFFLLHRDTKNFSFCT